MARGGTLLAALAEARTSAEAEGVRLADPGGFEVARVLAAVDDDAEAPRELVRVVLAALCETGAGARWVLARERAVALVGRWVLEEWDEAHPGGEMLYIAFWSRWKKMVPDGCEGLCKLAAIRGWYTQPQGNVVVYAPGGGDGVETAEGPGKKEVKKNKWHEKLRKK